MNEDFDFTTDFFVTTSLCLRISERVPALDYTDGMLRACCLQDVIDLAQEALTDWPAHQRASAATAIVRRAFQAEFPMIQPPSLHARFSDLFRGVDVCTLGQHPAAKVSWLGTRRAEAALSYICALIPSVHGLPIPL